MQHKAVHGLRWQQEECRMHRRPSRLCATDTVPRAGRKTYLPQRLTAAPIRRQDSPRRPQQEPPPSTTTTTRPDRVRVRVRVMVKDRAGMPRGARAERSRTSRECRSAGRGSASHTRNADPCLQLRVSLIGNLTLLMLLIAALHTSASHAPQLP